MKHYCPDKKIRVVKEKLPCYGKNDCNIKRCYTYLALKDKRANEAE